jgi:zinc D-Ala-D-Ala carboxypeptidase
VASEQLSEHFAREEFELDGPMPDAAANSYRVLCAEILEPIREHWGRPVKITSGYRSPDANVNAHGVANSQHVATGNYCAADFYIPAADMRALFDWIRRSPELPFDQVILEHGASDDIIHISWMRAYRRREALEGATNNKSAYTRWPSTEPTKSDA